MAFSNLTSNIFGHIAKINFPKPLQNFINQKYIEFFNINMSEFKNANEYENLNALFTRKLQKERMIEDDFISPCDGKILQCSKSHKIKTKHFAFSIKGKEYSLEELLKNNYDKNDLEQKLEYVNIYLSPKDYHRYHAPCDMQILSAAYTKGVLFSVNEKHLNKIKSVYTQNERVSLKCLIDNKFLVWLVFVGAQNVGKMRFNFDESIQTNAKIKHDFIHNYEKLYFKKGEELGNFELGSTIVIIAQKGFLDFKLQEMQQIKFGEQIAKFVKN
ncbi:phosphatidylserine decarboxylase [Campylobacter sp. CCS1377]|uniref:phosphatidylserine decarboxylase n=1 Tax=Campylobacter sp. CCS1377 TaxID=3158229 RepID=A0AAU7E7R2_9BACT|nr:phosphatidylserine decarboxylase [Campylobacter jejuni]